MKPATALPWTVLKAREDMSASIAELDGAYTNEPMHVNDAVYIAHACNAYPKLVAALLPLIEALAMDVPDHFADKHAEKVNAARALLRELGE